MQPKLIWIELSPDPKHALSVLADLKETFPKIPILVSYHVPDVSLMRASFRLGAFDFLDAETWRTDIGAAIQSIVPKKAAVRSQLSWQFR